MSHTSDERRSRLLEAMPAIAWSANVRTFAFDYVSPAAETLLGYPVDSWREPGFWFAHIHPEDLAVATFCHNETLAARDHELVYRMVAADGHSVWLRDYVKVHTVDGEPVELFGVMVDITREREAEIASAENRENFRRMVELSPDCIAVQVDGSYVYANHAFVQLVGAGSDADVVGRSIEDFVDPRDLQLVRERMAKVAAGQSVPYQARRFRRLDGSVLHGEVAAIPIRYGNRDAVQTIARDVTARLRDEEELRVREARLQLLAAGTHEAIWEWVPERKELWTNDAYRAMFGTPTDASTFFDEWLRRVHPDDREIAWTVFRSAIDGQTPTWRHEYRLRQADGTYAVVLDRGHTTPSPAGDPRFIGALLDVTSLRESERLRAAAEAKFRWLVEQSVVAVYMLSGGRLTYINETGARMLGYTADELLEAGLESVLEGEDRPAAVFAGGPSVSRVRHRDGQTLHLALYPKEVLVDGDLLTIGTAADVSDSVRARRALEASEQRHRELVEGVGDILFTVDVEGRFVSLSGSFERCTGHRVEAWIGRPFVELFCAVNGESGKLREYRVSSPDGAELTFEVSSQPRFVDGVAAGTIGMARDVTESRDIARKLEEAKRMSSLGQVAASLAHEFNNVLMGIQPFVEVIARDAAGSVATTSALGHITRAVARGKRASQEILRFANPKDPQLFGIDVRAWLPAFIGQLTAALPSSIGLTSAILPGVRFVRGDREHLEQVMTNLVFNARDAIVGNGTIDVRVGPSPERAEGSDGERVCISVSDDGPGIAPEKLDRIFEPLFTTKRNGTGLGLAIARRLMERQGGALTVENRPEGGASFHVLVPAAEAARFPAGPLLRARLNVKRVLLVEDDVSAGAGLERLLEAEGYETMWVRASADACEAAKQMNPEVAIIDVNLPDGSGVDLVPLLRADHAGLPIVLSTGHVELNLASDQNRILSLMKPYELTELLAAIGEVTGSED